MTTFTTSYPCSSFQSKISLHGTWKEKYMIISFIPVFNRTYLPYHSISGRLLLINSVLDHDLKELRKPNIFYMLKLISKINMLSYEKSSQFIKYLLLVVHCHYKLSLWFMGKHCISWGLLNILNHEHEKQTRKRIHQISRRTWKWKSKQEQEM